MTSLAPLDTQDSGQAQEQDLEQDAPASGEWDIGRLVAELRAARLQWRDGHRRFDYQPAQRLPSIVEIGNVVAALREGLFPMRLGAENIRETNEDFFVGHKLNYALSTLASQIELELGRTSEADAVRAHRADARRIAAEFASGLAATRRLLDTDVVAAYNGDPAARSFDEVLLCYPGVVAIFHHRIAHRLYKLGAPLIARIVAEIAHSLTGIDIHPGATIGTSFFIDHGTGVVVGETAIIGDRVRIYQAVTLGARSFPVDADGKLRKDFPRHPIIEDDVVIYSGATILGRVTIGKGSTIGGNVWLTESVAPGSHLNQAKSQRESADWLERPSHSHPQDLARTLVND